MSRTQILSRIKSALNKNHIFPANPHYKNVLNPQNQDLLSEYKYFQAINKATIIDTTLQKLPEDVLKTFDSIGAQRVLYALNLPFDFSKFECGIEKIPYDKNIEVIRSELFKVDTSILRAVCGIANLGIVGVVSSPNCPRLSSLIAPNCVILLDKTMIVQNLFEGTQILKNQGKDGKLPTNLLFIAGPSRTADIELQTVFGVHGPQKVTVILY
ncbi:lactate utilization protein C [Helicobacter sp. 13S00477-4]|uniref:LutC/YkgG family protein n=1 Tax=Helicobacter sp. 13S00477-4 TaxID=1905759 RepID=UPI000BA6A635|nr:lactate utilization protein C [Helicobacter sp. 13S00477-4]PAF51635.1 lactate utilization protein C [Helicobacter sp. 13S00477-4]